MRNVRFRRLLLAAGLAALASGCGEEASPAPPSQKDVSQLTEADIKLRLGLQMYQVGRFQEAIGLFEQTLALDPSNHEAQFNRASAMAQLDRDAEALAEFDRMLSEPAHQNDPAIFANRAITLNELGRSAEALENIDRALATVSTEAPWFLVRADTLLRLGRNAESLEAAQRAKALRPDLLQADLTSAQNCSALGRAAEADAIYDELLRTHPNDTALKQKITELRGR